MLRRGVERGDLRPDVDLEAVIDAYVGPIFYRFLISDAPLDDAFADTLVDSVIRALRHLTHPNKPASTNQDIAGLVTPVGSWLEVGERVGEELACSRSCGQVLPLAGLALVGRAM